MHLNRSKKYYNSEEMPLEAIAKEYWDIVSEVPSLLSLTLIILDLTGPL